MEQFFRLFRAIGEFAQISVAGAQIAACQGAADLVFVDAFYFHGFSLPCLLCG